MPPSAEPSPRPKPAEQMVFAETVEGLVNRALKGRMTPKLKARFLDAGLDLSKPYAAQYPKEMWIALLRASAEECYPELSLDLGLYALGVATFEGFGDTLMGRFLMRTLRVLGPKLTLNQLQKQFRSVNNYLDTRTTQLADNKFEIWMNECHGNPGFLRGVIYRGLIEAGAQDLAVTVKVFDGVSCTFSVSWR